MSILTILEYPDPRLLKIAAPVVVFDAALEGLCASMAETMYDATGVGLAATQVDVHQRIFVADVSPTRDQLQIFINPVLTEAQGEVVGEEGCLSIPGVRDNVTRAAEVTVRAQDVAGEYFTLQATELLARCVQHEIDHLNGVLFITYLSRLKQSRLRARVLKQQREHVS